jgi:hypothetical protein
MKNFLLVKSIEQKKALVGRLFFLVVAALFVGTRLYYWGHISEAPFSDMADYVSLGREFAEGQWLLHKQFWGAYHTPGVLLFHAAVINLTGSRSIEALRISQLVFLGATLLFLAWQLKQTSGTALTGALLLLVVAVSKSSVFWSYKVGSESVSEAWLYLTVGIALWVYRGNAQAWKYFVLGLIVMFGVFVRGNSLPLVGVLVLFPLFRLVKADKKKAAICAVSYALAVFCIWAPWVGRNYMYCEQFVPLTTQGPYTFLWEFGTIEAKIKDGRRVVTSVNQLQADATKQFPNDCKASQFASEVVRGWLTEHLNQYPAIIEDRLVRYATDHTEYLTKVSRTELHPKLDRVLIDKSGAMVVCAMVAGLVLSAYYAWARIVFSAVVLSVMFSALFLGYPRMFEPYVPLATFIALSPIIPLWNYIKRKLPSFNTT